MVLTLIIVLVSWLFDITTGSVAQGRDLFIDCRQLFDCAACLQLTLHPQPSNLRGLFQVLCDLGRQSETGKSVSDALKKSSAAIPTLPPQR
jgi:hypothetical protein